MLDILSGLLAARSHFLDYANFCILREGTNILLDFACVLYIYIYICLGKHKKRKPAERENIFCSFDFLDFFGVFVFYKMRDDMYNRHVQDDKLTDLSLDS